VTPEPLLKPTQRLAHGRSSHPEAFAGRSESSRLGNGGKHRHAIHVVRHSEAMLNASCITVK